MNYLPIIGLEVHVELKTKSKMFCGCSADYFGHEPNTHVCPVCLGLPGALPVPNKKAIEWCAMLGLALNCKIPPLSKFDRKNYFYPDLPKGYQISQYDNPLCVNGQLGKIRIRRVHMEEDTGKLIHSKEGTLIDFNRSGVPLVEVVTEPDIHSAQEAKIFLQKLQQIIRYLGISDADMEKGSMRCEPNVSVRNGKWQMANGKSDRELPNYKVEVKNINSFRFVEKAINYEIERQIDILKSGGKVGQETRGWLEAKGITLPQRGKEEAQDYRYFPEPDIPPMRWQQSTINSLQLIIPELPDAKLERFMKDYGLSQYDGSILTSSLPVADYFEEAVRELKGLGGLKGFKAVANWIINKRINIAEVSPGQLVQMIFQKAAPFTISEEELKKVVEKVLLDNPKAVSDYKSGKTQALMFLVGQVLKETQGQAEPEKVREKLVALIPRVQI
ncbi:Asp-tRNA(Asn)/Glu-tRNA(Gln) amidotransferase subunit GatB [Candidatus Gottesmanbacteria bacterium]|nr:Asp-tRNA(Asn)/Glu-tRNA(Gln) amidotransferase subunit GatB [Candidatus Gottesmanbacteria bacterium]